MQKVLGIDLGATYSSVAYIDQFGIPTILSNAEGKKNTPSVIYITEDQKVAIGDAALRLAKTGSKENLFRFDPKELSESDVNNTFHKGHVSAANIAQILLKKLVDDANETLKEMGLVDENDAINTITIAIHQFDGEEVSAKIEKIAHNLKLNVLEIMPDYKANLLGSGAITPNSNGVVLVCDLGGKYLKATGVNLHDGDMECLFSIYNEQLNCGYYLPTETDLQRDPSLKEPYNALLKDIIEKVQDLMDQAIEKMQESGYEKDKIKRIMLSGGLSRMKEIHSMLSKSYGIPISSYDPDDTTTRGAVIYANMLLKDPAKIKAMKAAKGKNKKAPVNESNKNNKKPSSSQNVKNKASKQKPVKEKKEKKKKEPAPKKNKSKGTNNKSLTILLYILIVVVFGGIGAMVAHFFL